MQQSETAPAQTRFDVKALRLATHGWLLGNPLVYKPGAADLTGIARELARAGSASGTLVLGDAGAANDANDIGGATAQAILLLRLPMSPAALGSAAAEAISAVVGEMFGYPCGVRTIAGQWDVEMRNGASSRVVAHVSALDEDGAALLGLRFAFDALWDAGHDARHDAGGQPVSPLLTRPDWREVLLARALHALDMRLTTGI
jgi:hypothetical protein